MEKTMKEMIINGDKLGIKN